MGQRRPRVWDKERGATVRSPRGLCGGTPLGEIESGATARCRNTRGVHGPVRVMKADRAATSRPAGRT